MERYFQLFLFCHSSTSSITTNRCQHWAPIGGWHFICATKSVVVVGVVMQLVGENYNLKVALMRAFKLLDYFNGRASYLNLAMAINREQQATTRSIDVATRAVEEKRMRGAKFEPGIIKSFEAKIAR